MRKWFWICGTILAMFAAGFATVAAISAVRNMSRDFRFTEGVVWDKAELNAILTASLEFENNTDEPLLVSEFETTCGCILLSGGGSSTGRNTAFTLPAQSKHILDVSITNRGIPGEGLRHLVSFSVDKYPERRFHTELLIRNVIGTLSSSPAAVVLADAIVGESKEFVIEVLDKATETRDLVDYEFRIPGLDITHIEHIRSPVSSEVDAKSRSRVIAKVHFVYCPPQSGHYKGEIGFFIGMKGIKHVVEFASHVTGFVSVIPSNIVLPRVTGNGDDYSMRIAFRGKPDSKLQLLEISLPPGFTYTEENNRKTTTSTLL